MITPDTDKPAAICAPIVKQVVKGAVIRFPQFILAVDGIRKLALDRLRPKRTVLRGPAYLAEVVREQTTIIILVEPVGATVARDATAPILIVCAAMSAFRSHETTAPLA